MRIPIVASFVATERQMAGSGVVKRTAGGRLVSPYWCTNFLFNGKRVQKPTTILIGDDEDASKAQAEAWVAEWKRQAEAEATQAAIDQKAGYRRGTLGEAYAL